MQSNFQRIKVLKLQAGTLCYNRTNIEGSEVKLTSQTKEFIIIHNLKFIFRQALWKQFQFQQSFHPLSY